MIGQLDHLVLTTTDEVACLDFYTRVLGMTLENYQTATGLPRKAETPERLFALKDNLSLYNIKGEHAAVVLTAEQVTAAILAHRAAAKTTAKNLLVPKPKPEAEVHKPGQRQRKPMPARKRKV